MADPKYQDNADIKYFEMEANRLEKKIMWLFSEAMSSPERRNEVYDFIGGVPLSSSFGSDPMQIDRTASGYYVLKDITKKVLGGKWYADIEEDISGNCHVRIIGRITVGA